jgi:hypothetical protein
LTDDIALLGQGHLDVSPPSVEFVLKLISLILVLIRIGRKVLTPGKTTDFVHTVGSGCLNLDILSIDKVRWVCCKVTFALLLLIVKHGYGWLSFYTTTLKRLIRTEARRLHTVKLSCRCTGHKCNDENVCAAVPCKGTDG